MKTYRLTPFAPLVLRTGKPFGETGGGDSFPFPLPSTVAGALRTVYADQQTLDFKTEGERIKSLSCHGAIPAAISANEHIEALFPRPADVFYTRQDNALSLIRMVPGELEEGEGGDLPGGLLPVFMEKDDKSKPSQGPVWWTEKAMHQWLAGDTPDPETLGPEQLPTDMRTHVALDCSTLAAENGRLFQSSGLDFEARRKPCGMEIASDSWEERRYALLSRFSEVLTPSLARVGGEARLSAVAPCEAWPKLPDTLRGALAKAANIRLVLATPALFSGGWLPGWIKSGLIGSPPGIPDLKLRLKAAAIDRWQPVSGWDMAVRKPKAVRRLAPTGAVYWFEVLESEEDWVEKLWLCPISDSEQDQRDGFGLTLPGIWTK